VTHTHPRPMSEPCPHIPTNLTNRPITNPPLCDVQKVLGDGRRHRCHLDQGGHAEHICWCTQKYKDN
jgi:hypothetical protein